MLARALLTGALLALLALPLLARVREVAPGILELGRGPGEVAIQIDVSLRALDRLTEPIEGLACRGVVALSEALGGVPQGRAGRAARLACGGLQLGQRGGKRLALGRREVIELAAELLQVLGGLLRIAVLVGVRLASGGARQGPAEGGERGRALFVCRIELRAGGRLGARDLGEVEFQVLRPLTQLPGEVSKLLGEPRPGIVRVRALCFEVLRDLIDAIGLLLGLFLDALSPGDRRVLGIWEEDEWNEQQRSDQCDRRRVARRPGPKEVRGSEADGRNGVSPLTANEPLRLLGFAAGSSRRRAFPRPGLPAPES